MSFEDFKGVYLDAYALGLKGCTTFRPNAVTGSVLSRAGRGSAEAAPASAAAAGSLTKLPAALIDGDAAAARPGARRWTPGGRRLHGQAAGARGRAGRLHLQAQVAGQRPRHVHHHQRHRARTAGARPFEVFINSKNLEHYAWTVALTRMISAIFRRGGDVAFVVEELKAVFDPQGGQWMGGRYVPSLLAAIGQVIETHMIRTGFLVPERPRRAPRRPSARCWRPVTWAEARPVRAAVRHPSIARKAAGCAIPAAIRSADETNPGRRR